jgi:hypothetical protein
MDFGIGPGQALLLRAALSTDRADAAAALEKWWKGIADFDDVRGTDAALFPQVYWNLGETIASPKLRARIRGAARRHWIANQYLITSCGEVLDLLQQASIPALFLKGAAIATTIEDDPGLRTMSDCDVLVPRERALDVIRILASAGLVEPVRIDRHLSRPIASPAGRPA